MHHHSSEQAATAEERDEFLRVEELLRNGEPVNVIKDETDHIAFPGTIPQEINSPPTSQHDKTTAAGEGTRENAPRNKTRSDFEADNKTLSFAKTDIAPQRPNVEKKFVTELPGRQGGARMAAPAAPRRSGTSYMNPQGHSIYGWDQSGDSSSSDSSSDDDEDGAPISKARQEALERRRREMEEHRRFQVGNENYKTKGKVKKDGRLRISVKETANTGYLAKALGHAVKKIVPWEDGEEPESPAIQRPVGAPQRAFSEAKGAEIKPPHLNIVIMVVGSRGDAQPFLKVGKVLKEKYGHRVRIATHPAFREFVEKDSGLEFFSVGGDPSELMAFMVKNPGLIPTLETVKAGDIGRRRAAMATMFEGFWRACINATDDEKDSHNLKMMGDKTPFVADAIIANPPSFAHMHCAEALGIPLHLMFTFPYTPTQAFPHPLASIKKSNVDPGYTNFISYPLVEMMVWQGLGDLVNDFRTKTLQLDPVSTLWAPGQSYRLHVPFTYMWSPGLVPKPQDWGEEIDVSGFVFLDLASTFKPPSDLEKFLAAGDKPIYIGFGSIVVDDPDNFTNMIFEAVKRAGVRVLLSKGWGGFGGDNAPDNVFMLENTPHDWLFPKVKACVIHGGAGTTAIALKCALPTMVVPFFGDQHFWGSMIGRYGAGPMPVPYKDLTVDKLVEGIEYCLTDEAKSKAAEIAHDIDLEGDGAENAVQSFHRHLNISGEKSMRCSVLPDRVACWKLQNSSVKLSATAADAIVERGHLSWRKLELLRHREWNDFEGPGEPLTGVASSLVNTVGDTFSGVGSVPYRMAKLSQKRTEKKKKKQRLRDLRTQRRNKVKTRVPNGAQTTNGDNSQEQSNGNLHQHAETKKETVEMVPVTPGAGATPQQNSQPANGSVHKDDNGTDATTNGANGASARPTAQGRLTNGTMSSVETVSTVGNPVEEYAEELGSGLGKTAGAIAKAPIDLSVALAQGFHNAPRLYGDDTVRRTPRVTDMKSGLKAAGFEFRYGIYDGVTGVVRLPIRGAKKEGPLGFVKGTGMGLTGLVLKPISAVIAPFGYTLKGVVKQAERNKQPDRIIRKSRIMQGQRELGALDQDARKEVQKQAEAGWATMTRLWEALESAEKKGKHGLRRKLGIHKYQGLHAAFESVTVAERTLAALERGEDIEQIASQGGEMKKAVKDRDIELGFKGQTNGLGHHQASAAEDDDDANGEPLQDKKPSEQISMDKKQQVRNDTIDEGDEPGFFDNVDTTGPRTGATRASA